MLATLLRKHARRYSVPGLPMVALAGLSVRYVWTLSRLETGWAMQREEGSGAVNRLIGREVTPLGKRLPAEQARFWTDELSRIEETRRDARLAIGAAWILHAPQMGYRTRLMTYHPERAALGLPLGTRFDLDMETIRRLEDGFETITAPTCLSLAETATRLEPGNVGHWRARALLLFAQTGFTELKPRRADWLDVLDECRRHDPDNALYDHLAALALWTASATYGMPPDGYDGGFELRVSDEPTFQEAVSRFEVGLLRPHLRFETDPDGPTAAVLERTDLSPFDRLDVVESRPLSFVVTRLIYGLVRWQQVRKDSAVRADRLDDGVDHIRKIRRLADQMGETDWDPDLATYRGRARLWALASFANLNRKHVGLSTAEDAVSIERELNDVRLEMAMLQEAGRRFKERRRPSPMTSLLTILPALAAQVLMSVVLLTAGVAGVSLIARRLAAGPADCAGPRLPVGRTFAWWLGGSLLGGGLAVLVTAALRRGEVQSPLPPAEVLAHAGVAGRLWHGIAWVAPLSGSVGLWILVGGSIAVPLIAAMYRFRCQSSSGSGTLLRRHRRELVSLGVRSVLASSLIGLAVCGPAYLSIAPVVAGQIETGYRRRVERPRLGPPAAAEVENTLSDIRADRQVIERLQREIDEHQRKLREQEAAAKSASPEPSVPQGGDL